MWLIERASAQEEYLSEDVVYLIESIINSGETYNRIRPDDIYKIPNNFLIVDTSCTSATSGSIDFTRIKYVAENCARNFINKKKECENEPRPIVDIVSLKNLEEDTGLKQYFLMENITSIKDWLNISPNTPYVVLHCWKDPGSIGSSCHTLSYMVLENLADSVTIRFDGPSRPSSQSPFYIGLGGQVPTPILDNGRAINFNSDMNLDNGLDLSSIDASIIQGISKWQAYIFSAGSEQKPDDWSHPYAISATTADCCTYLLIQKDFGGIIHDWEIISLSNNFGIAFVMPCENPIELSQSSIPRPTLILIGTPCDYIDGCNLNFSKIYKNPENFIKSMAVILYEYKKQDRNDRYGTGINKINEMLASFYKWCKLQ